MDLHEPRTKFPHLRLYNRHSKQLSQMEDELSKSEGKCDQIYPEISRN